MSLISIGVVGDLHTHFDEIDVAHFDRSDYDLLFFTGDLGGGPRESSLRMARLMSRLRKPALVMPGNNDTGNIDELAAELAHGGGIAWLSALRRGEESEVEGIGGVAVRLCGYSAHRLRRGAIDVTLVAARPHSMGGSELSFPAQLRASHGIGSMEESRRRLVELVDAIESPQVVFLAHNGPSGLGEHSHAIWGCDFRPGAGDWGDPDLAAAIDHARARGLRVSAVVAGHMHLHTRCGNERPWRLERDEVLYINAARVPRIFAAGNEVHRHHVALRIGIDGVHAEEVLLS